MKRIVTFDDFKNASNQWKPVLTKVNTIEEAADNINFPHEDYDDFVEQTQLAIEEIMDILQTRHLVENDLKFIHKICMDGKEGLQLGRYRMGEVTVGDNLIPPQPYLIPSMLMSIMPVGTEYQKTEEDIINWYKEFETIHPFEDGNGRVGGVVLAAMSKVLTGKFIVSKKEYHYFLNYFLKKVNRVEDKDKYLTDTLNSDSMDGKKLRKILEETKYQRGNLIEHLNSLI
jgi:hypothetical protein